MIKTQSMFQKVGSNPIMQCDNVTILIHVYTYTTIQKFEVGKIF